MAFHSTIIIFFPTLLVHFNFHSLRIKLVINLYFVKDMTMLMTLWFQCVRKYFPFSKSNAMHFLLRSFFFFHQTQVFRCQWISLIISLVHNNKMQEPLLALNISKNNNFFHSFYGKMFLCKFILYKSAEQNSFDFSLWVGFRVNEKSFVYCIYRKIYLGQMRI